MQNVLKFAFIPVAKKGQNQLRLKYLRMQQVRNILYIWTEKLY